MMDEQSITKAKAESVQEQEEAVLETSKAGLGEKFKEWKPLYHFFDLDEKPRHDEALSKIWFFAKRRAETPDKESVIWEVKKLINLVGSPSLGDPPYAKLEIYVDAWLRQREAEKIMREMEHGQKGTS